MGALDNLTPRSSYDGVAFFYRSQGGSIPSVPRLSSQGSALERIAPYSYPANIVRQVINTGLLDDMTVPIACTGAALTSLRAKVETGMKSLILAGDAAQSCILTKVSGVQAVTTQGYLYVTLTLRGKG